MAALTFKETARFGEHIHATPGLGDFVDAARALVQNLHRRVLAGNLHPCAACAATPGQERYTDAGGSRDWRNCPVCDGWGVC